MGLQEDIKKCKSPRKGPNKAYKAKGFTDKNNKDIIKEIVECDLTTGKERVVYKNKEYAKLKRLNNK